ncbi:hypothetical protein BpHYR1_049300 [Brachionus plicatilis]|uniref:Uncharacterized protein n=1 Tax=Brachionus plicatilis TaxID=10195 RepID=A0A3M7SDV2_BRAPC|nr:hypothetical protein BpHYR1_049300 [Brachionus plicatilis]
MSSTNTKPFTSPTRMSPLKSTNEPETGSLSPDDLTISPFSSLITLKQPSLHMVKANSLSTK